MTLALPDFAQGRWKRPKRSVEVSCAAEEAGWSAHGRPVQGLYLFLLMMFAALTSVGLLGYFLRPHIANDFFAFQSFSRFISQHRPALIYDQDLLRSFQDLPRSKLFAFMYPPSMMLLVWPLAFMSYSVGYFVWIGFALVAYLLAVAWRDWSAASIAVVAPSTLWCILCGQTSMLVVGLLIGGLSISRERPVLGGVLLGLAAYKPQLGVLVPIALVASGQWRTIATASATVLCVVLASTLVFGWTVWAVWFEHLPQIVQVRVDHAVDWAPLLATVASNLVMLGVDVHMADMVQSACFIGAAVCVWICFRSGAGALEVAVLAAATFLATPFAFTYDMPLITASVLLFVRERRRAQGAFRFGEVLVIVASFLLPCFVLAWLQCLTSLVVLALLCCIVLRALDVGAGGRRVTGSGFGVIERSRPVLAVAATTL